MFGSREMASVEEVETAAPGGAFGSEERDCEPMHPPSDSMTRCIAAIRFWMLVTTLDGTFPRTKLPAIL
jgi:hypothetical protein